MFSLDPEQYIQHVGYVFTFLAISIRDVLWLRCVLAVAQTLLFIYAISYPPHDPRYDVAIWNTIFFIVNLYYVISIYKERQPVPIPESISDIYINIFSQFTTREFIQFWNLGSDVSDSSNQPVITDGADQDSLIIILSGNAIVKKNNREVAKLTRGSFVAEMSLLTGKPALADVFGSENFTYRQWDRQKLSDIESGKQNLWIKLQYILTRDLSAKIDAMNQS